MKLSLRFKLILLTTSLVTATQLATGFFIVGHMEKTMDAQYHRQIMPLAINLARVCTNALLGKDLHALRNLLRITLEQENIVQTMIIDTTGKIIMHNRLIEVGKLRTGEHTQIALQAEEPGLSDHYLGENGDQQTDIYVPIKVSGVRIGTIFMTCTHKHIAKQLDELKQHILTILVCGFLASILCAILLAAYLTRPLQLLTIAAGKITTGVFPTENLKIYGNDELAALTDSFNKMTNNLRTMVYHDPLTGAYNRQMFQQRIAQEFAHARRHNHPLALLMIDVDHFKTINDTHGHLIGDQVLKEISDTLLATVRADDYVARFGGEEFVVIAPNTSAETALVLAERVRAGIAAHPFRINDKNSSQLTISIGVANLSPKINSVDDLLRHADTALYAAKDSGRNTVCRAED